MRGHRPGRQLRQVVDQPLLRFGRNDRSLQRRLFVLERLDGVLNAPSFRGSNGIVRTRHGHAAGVNGTDLQFARGLTLHTDGRGDGICRQLREQQRVLAEVELDLADAGDFVRPTDTRDGIDARGAFDFSGMCTAAIAGQLRHRAISKRMVFSSVTGVAANPQTSCAPFNRERSRRSCPIVRWARGSGCTAL